MNRTARRQQKKRTKKTARPQAAVQQAQTGVQNDLQQGITHHQAGQLDAAIRWYQRVLAADPDNVTALGNMGYGLLTQGKFIDAVAILQKAIAIQPNYPEAYYNLGNAQKAQGKLTAAVASLKKAISLRAHYPEALNNLGNAIKEQGNRIEAAAYMQQAINQNPGFAPAYNNLGVIFIDNCQLDDAITVLQQAVNLNPDFPDAYYNLGTAKQEQGKLDQAIACYSKAIAINPGYAEAHCNLGNAYIHKNNLAQAVAHIKQAITIKPDLLEAFHNLGCALEAMCYTHARKTAADAGIESICSKLPMPSGNDLHAPHNPMVSVSLEVSIINFRVKKLMGEKVQADQEMIMRLLPSVAQETIANAHKPQAPAIINSTSSNTPPRVVAFLGLASAASGLFHSMLDNHPEISIMPGVYMSGYFGRGVWQKIAKSGYRGTTAQFARLYEVLFDSRSPCKPPPHHIGDKYGTVNGIGIDEGFDKLGESHNTPLLLEQNKFTAKLSKILDSQESINLGSFFLHVHNAYEHALGNDFGKKRIVLHHLHKFDRFSMSNLLKHYPDARILTIVRNPVLGLESWGLKDVSNKNLVNWYKKYDNIVAKIAYMIRDINSCEFSSQDAVGIRLEDIKNDRENTMQRLCTWLGIADSPTLYESTIQGLQWWGDPGSALFGKSQTADHGKDEPIRKRKAILFSDRDRHILNTLFYPFNARFDYVESNQDKFIRDLKEVRPLLEQPLDFEMMLAEKFPPGYPNLEATAAFQFFHAMLLGRWRILKSVGTFPDMFKTVPK